MDDPRFSEYETRYRCRFTGGLGLRIGQDGRVLRTDRLSAVKFFDREQRFRRELEVYQVLDTKGILSIAGHHVPRLLGFDDALLTIEMTVVSRPFVLDFAGAKWPWEIPDFGEDVMEDYHARLREYFGPNWADALHVAAMFKLATGFELTDLHPGNIAFDDLPTS
jgi:hypothetical protein